jgi:hypothetical protein
MRHLDKIWLMADIHAMLVISMLHLTSSALEVL